MLGDDEDAELVRPGQPAQYQSVPHIIAGNPSYQPIPHVNADNLPYQPIPHVDTVRFDLQPIAAPIEENSATISIGPRLHQAISQDDTTYLKKLLADKECNEDALCYKDSNGNTILHIAVMNRNAGKIDAILRSSAYSDSIIHIKNNDNKEVWDLGFEFGMCDALTVYSAALVNDAIAKEQQKIGLKPGYLEHHLLNNFLMGIKSLPLRRIAPSEARKIQKMVIEMSAVAHDPANVFQCSETLYDMKFTKTSWMRLIIGAVLAIICAAFLVFCTCFGIASAGLPVAFLATLGLIVQQSPFAAGISLGFGAPTLTLGTAFCTVFAVGNAVPKRTIATADMSKPPQSIRMIQVT